jgi:alpha-1,3-rhamnosyltransferase
MIPWRIERQVAYMADKPGVGISAGNIETIDGKGKTSEKQHWRDLPFRRLSFDGLFLSKKRIPPTPTLMFRRNVLMEVGGFDENIRLENPYI